VIDLTIEKVPVAGSKTVFICRYTLILKLLLTSSAFTLGDDDPADLRYRRRWCLPPDPGPATILRGKGRDFMFVLKGLHMSSDT